MDWLARVELALRLASAGVIVLVDGARDAHLPALLRALSRARPDVAVCLSPGELDALPPDAWVVYRPAPGDAEALNLGRPRFARDRWRVVLWCDAAASAALARGAPDFFDWISHRVEAPRTPAPFAVEALRLAAERVPGVVWKGPGAFDDVVAAAGERVGARVALGADLASLVEALRATLPAKWVLVDGVADDEAMFHLRCACAIAGRRGRVAALAAVGGPRGWWSAHVPGADAPEVTYDEAEGFAGWTLLDDRETDLPEVAERLRGALGARATSVGAMLGAEAAGVRVVEDALATGMEIGALEEVLWAATDPPAALAQARMEGRALGHEEGIDAPTWALEFLGEPDVRASWTLDAAVELRRRWLGRLTEHAVARSLGAGPIRSWWASRAAVRELPAWLFADPGRSTARAGAWAEALLRGGALSAAAQDWLRSAVPDPAIWAWLDERYPTREGPVSTMLDVALAFKLERFRDAGARLDALLAVEGVASWRDGGEAGTAARVFNWLGRYRDADAVAGESTPERLRALVRSADVASARAAFAAWPRTATGGFRGDGGPSAFVEYHLLTGEWLPAEVSFAGLSPDWERDLLASLDAEFLLLHGYAAQAAARLGDSSPRPRSYARALIEHTRARIAIARSAFADADAALALAVPLLGELLGERSHFAVRTLVTRADLRVRQGRYAESAADLTAAIDAMAEALPSDHPDLLDARRALALVPGRRDAVAADRALEALASKLGEAHPRVRRLAAR